MTGDSTVDVCPECDRPGFEIATVSRADHDRTDRYRYRCRCGHEFDEPRTRERQHTGSIATSTLTKKLIEADPDDVGGAVDG